MRYYLLLLVILLSSACRPVPKAVQKLTGKTMGTYYSISLIAERGSITKASIDSLLFAISDKSTSTYEKESTISQFNSSAHFRTADEHFLAVFDISKRLHKQTEAAFDPTVMPLVNAYGFGPQTAKNINQNEIDSLLLFIGFEKLIKAAIGGKKEVVIAKVDPRVQLDFSAVAKGYAVDRVGDFIRAKGIDSYLVDIGGEVVASGKKADGSLWNLGVDRPIEDEARKVSAIIPLENQAVATSGNYRNYKIINGQKVVHTINPKTGKPEISNLLSATILAEDCATADALATACMVMGLEKAKNLIQSDGKLEAYFIYGVKDKLSTWQSDGIRLTELNAE